MNYSNSLCDEISVDVEWIPFVESIIKKLANEYPYFIQKYGSFFTQSKFGVRARLIDPMNYSYYVGSGEFTSPENLEELMELLNFINDDCGELPLHNLPEFSKKYS